VTACRPGRAGSAEPANGRTTVKTNAADMLKQVNETRNPIVITQNGKAKAVLLDTESYQDMRKTMCPLLNQ
jgi:prevent-host-death family protein